MCIYMAGRQWRKKGEDKKGKGGVGSRRIVLVCAAHVRAPNVARNFVGGRESSAPAKLCAREKAETMRKQGKMKTRRELSVICRAREEAGVAPIFYLQRQAQQAGMYIFTDLYTREQRVTDRFVTSSESGGNLQYLRFID